MRTRRNAILATALTLLLMLAAQPAAALSPRAAAAETGGAAVTGESWSSPAFPVDCVRASNQINCTPQAAADIKAQRCFTGVLAGGGRTTVCTTYKEHAEAIQAAGGKETIVQYGCSIGDLVCVTFENAGRGMALASMAMMFTFAQVVQFDTSTTMWDAAVAEWSFWAWAVLIVLFIAMIWSVTAAVVARDREQLVGAIVRSFIAIPAVPITLWLTGHVINAVDDMTWYILSKGSVAGLLASLQDVMWSGGEANYFFAFLIHGLLLVAMFLLMLVFTFRNIALAALIMIGPVAWMLFPVRSIGPQWVVRYASAVAVMLLTGPLTIGFVSFIVTGLSNLRSIWDPQSWPLIIGLILVTFAPFAVFGLFNFVGGVAADSIGSRLGSGSRHLAAGAGRKAMAIPSRLGATAAGVPAGGAAGAGAAAAGAGAAGRARSSIRSAASPAGASRTLGTTATASSRPGATGATGSAPAASAPSSTASPARAASPAAPRPAAVSPTSPSAPVGRSAR